MPRPLKQGIIGASTIILSKDIDKYAYMCGSNFYESDVNCEASRIWLSDGNLFRVALKVVIGIVTSPRLLSVSVSDI